MNEELDHEDGNKERRHDAACCVPGCGAQSPRKVEKGLFVRLNYYIEIGSLLEWSQFAMARVLPTAGHASAAVHANRIKVWRSACYCSPLLSEQVPYSSQMPPTVPHVHTVDSRSIELHFVSLYLSLDFLASHAAQSASPVLFHHQNVLPNFLISSP